MHGARSGFTRPKIKRYRSPQLYRTNTKTGVPCAFPALEPVIKVFSDGTSTELDTRSTWLKNMDVVNKGICSGRNKCPLPMSLLQNP